jgi:hypothetical protein
MRLQTRGLHWCSSAICLETSPKQRRTKCETGRLALTTLSEFIKLTVSRDKEKELEVQNGRKT